MCIDICVCIAAVDASDYSHAYVHRVFMCICIYVHVCIWYMNMYNIYVYVHVYRYMRMYTCRCGCWTYAYIYIHILTHILHLFIYHMYTCGRMFCSVKVAQRFRISKRCIIQHTATHDSTLQHFAAHSTLQRTALIHMWHDTYRCDSLIHTWRDSSRRDTDASIYDMTRPYVTWLIYTWHDSSMYDMTHTYVPCLTHTWHDPEILSIAPPFTYKVPIGGLIPTGHFRKKAL